MLIFEKIKSKKHIDINSSEGNPVLVYTAVILVIPALFINLGLMPTLGDEATRALVALELLIRDDLISPTINGEYYLNKPPLYNWILILIFKYVGNASEFYIRLPAVISLILYSIIIFFTSRKILGYKYAVINAFAFITFGRMLFDDSMLGHIDILFSLVIYLAIFSIWFYFNKQSNYRLFIFSYLLASIAFLMKGLPAIVFLGVSFSSVVIIERNIKRFLSIAHLAGLSLFILIIGTYFYLYNLENDTSELIKTFWHESSKRTAFENEGLLSFQYFLTFPFEYFFRLAPWSFLIISCIRKDLSKIIKSNPYILFCFLIVVSNIIVYWLSPETRPRYIFSLIPYIFTLLIYVYQIPGAEKQKRITDILFFVTFIFFTLASLLPVIVEVPADIPFKILKTLFFFIVFLVLTVLSLKIKSQRFILLVILLLIARIEFNLFVLPSRLKVAPESIAKNNILKIKLPDNLPIYIYKNADVKHSVSYYLTREKKEIIKHDREGTRNDVYYIVRDFNLPEYPFKVLAKFTWDGPYYIVRK